MLLLKKEVIIVSLPFFKIKSKMIINNTIIFKMILSNDTKQSFAHKQSNDCYFKIILDEK